jgi:spore coat protein A
MAGSWLTRRAFLRAGVAGLAGLRVAELGAVDRQMPVTAPSTRSPSARALDLRALAPFIDPLPIPPVIRPDDRSTTRIALREIASRIHRDVPPTRFWSFGSTFPGPTIEVRKGRSAHIDWANELPASHFLPIDHTIHGAGAEVPDVRAAVHVHGARVPAASDGHPDRWFTPGQHARYTYPNHQDAATLWYHDHTMGINRLNVYAGLMGAFLIRDDEEDALNLPNGEHELPLIICDRAFTADGQLDYPVSGDPKAPWVPEIACDAMLVNGVLTPFLSVEARKYRLRVINGSNARFLSLGVWPAKCVQIGSDQGLLAAPVSVDEVHLAPAERVDLVVDFTAHRGDTVALTNDRRPLVQFRVSRLAVDDRSEVPPKLRTIARLAESSAVATRVHTLAEDLDLLSRPMRMLINGVGWHAPVTERVRLGTTEIWSLANVTDDPHPIHLHLVRFQVLDRRPFDLWRFTSEGKVVYTGDALPPEPGEMGWKDTVRADAGMITRILVPFEGYAGNYMWHCHVLEHGDNEMMRPLEVVSGLINR